MSMRSKVKIPPLAAQALAADLDDAIKRRSVPEILAFSREAELSGLDQLASRGREIADVIEAKAAQAGRAELIRLKAELRPPEPTQAELARRFDDLVMGNLAGGSPEAAEHQRVENANAQLASRNQQIEEQRRRQVTDEPEPWWR